MSDVRHPGAWPDSKPPICMATTQAEYDRARKYVRLIWPAMNASRRKGVWAGMVDSSVLDGREAALMLDYLHTKYGEA